MIVSDVAGTTRDAIDLPMTFEDRAIVLVDTAGLRRQAKVGESLEYYTALRSQRAAERADVALVVCDATDGVTAQDFRVAEMAMKSGCATALVLNKWDLQAETRAAVGPDELDHERIRVNRKLRLRPRVLTASAKTGRTSSGSWSRPSGSPTAAATGSRPHSSTASSPTWSPSASRRRATTAATATSVSS